MADQEDLVDAQIVEKEREIRPVADSAGAWVSMFGQTNLVEARPVDPVEPRFTGQNGEWPARMKVWVSDRIWV
jgi:hypothetical protein